MVRKILLVVGAFAIVFLVYLLSNSISNPLKFQEEYDKRSTEVINKLKDIRTLQEQYKNTNNAYCSTIDSLIDFAFNGDALLVQKFGTVPDNMTEAEALKQGLLRRDTVKVNPLEKLSAEGRLLTPKDKIRDLKYIPYSDREVFHMQAGNLDKSGIQVAVFEVKAPIETYTKGMDEQAVKILRSDLEKKKDGFAGWKIGSMEEPITDGNFE